MYFHSAGEKRRVTNVVERHQQDNIIEMGQRRAKKKCLQHATSSVQGSSSEGSSSTSHDLSRNIRAARGFPFPDELSCFYKPIPGVQGGNGTEESHGEGHFLSRRSAAVTIGDPRLERNLLTSLLAKIGLPQVPYSFFVDDHQNRQDSDGLSVRQNSSPQIIDPYSAGACLRRHSSSGGSAYSGDILGFVRSNHNRDNSSIREAGMLESVATRNAMRELRESFSDEAEIATCDHVPYFGQKDQWSCGYQNLRMILGSLYRMILSTDKEIMLPRNWISCCTRRCSAPSVEILQLMLEEAWRSGFDVEGGGHFGNRVFGTPQWIGATEAHALLSSIGFRTRIIDFEHGNPGERVVQWVSHYFFSNEDRPPAAYKPYNCARHWGCLWRWSAARTLPPVYLQYDSHSKTIVGAVREDDGRTFILCLDPAKNPSSALQDGHVRTVKLSAADLDCQAYQIVHVLIGKSMSVEQWTFARNPNNGNMKC